MPGKPALFPAPTLFFAWRALPNLAKAQASCLVVDTRAAAEEVLRAYEARRAGIVTCKIAAEHDQDRCMGGLIDILYSSPSFPASFDTVMCRHSIVSMPAIAGLDPLLAHIDVEPNAAGAQCIFNAMLGSWLMARDRTCVPSCVRARGFGASMT